MIAAVLVACSEYEFGEDVDPNDLDDTASPYAGEVRVGCLTNYDGVLPWRTTGPWFDLSPPRDAADVPWTEHEFDDGAWTVVPALPDRDPATTNHEVYYRSVFWLDDVVGETTLGLRGNDGVWLFVNERFVGHWGGEIREPGCVNVEEACGVSYDVDPIDVTEFLRAGRNLLAVQLTNGPLGYSLDINAHCVR